MNILLPKKNNNKTKIKYMHVTSSTAYLFDSASNVSVLSVTQEVIAATTVLESPLAVVPVLPLLLYFVSSE